MDGEEVSHKFIEVGDMLVISPVYALKSPFLRLCIIFQLLVAHSYPVVNGTIIGIELHILEIAFQSRLVILILKI